MFEFLPTKKDRKISSKDFIGKMVEIEAQHLSEDKKKQYVCTRSGNYASGWVDKIGEPNTKFKRKIIDAWFMESMNGGRSDHQKYDSYKAYFNDEKKIEVQKFWKSGLLGRINRGGGDLDRIDLYLQFKDFVLYSSLYNHHAPEEWYSDMHKGNFEFEKGFYFSAEEAIHFFADKPHDDLFGERYFPVLVFPKDTESDVRSISEMAKNCSKPIMTKDYIIFGTRCKPSEYSEVIKETYESGGKIARSMEWNW